MKLNVILGNAYRTLLATIRSARRAIVQSICQNRLETHATEYSRYIQFTIHTLNISGR